MKLRNKETGEIKEYTHTMTSYHVPIEGGYEIFTPWKPEEWEELEDVKEPYIKDKKVRKFVRDWAEHWKIDKVIIRFIDSNRIDLIGFPSPSSTKTGREIDIQRTVVRNEIIYGNRYTIDELCGEEG